LLIYLWGLYSMFRLICMIFVAKYKTQHNNQECCHSMAPNASTSSLAYALRSTHTYVCLLLPLIFDWLPHCCSFPELGHHWLRQTSRPHCGYTLIWLNKQIESETLQDTESLEDPL
jgi:hypothetical protein